MKFASLFALCLLLLLAVVGQACPAVGVSALGVQAASASSSAATSSAAAGAFAQPSVVLGGAAVLPQAQVLGYAVPTLQFQALGVQTLTAAPIAVCPNSGCAVQRRELFGGRSRSSSVSRSRSRSRN